MRARPNDALPKLVMNCVGVQRRPEISIADFCKAIELEAAAVIAFEPKLFGVAANNGQMIAEVELSSKIAETFSDLARLVTGRSEIRKAKRTLFDPLMAKFRKKAS